MTGQPSEKPGEARPVVRPRRNDVKELLRYSNRNVLASGKPAMLSPPWTRTLPFPSRVTVELRHAAWSVGPGFQPLLEESKTVSYTHLRAHETPEHLVCRLLL